MKNNIQEYTLLKFLYILFIALLFAFFVGIGIDTFYISPERPEYMYKEMPCSIIMEDKTIMPEQNIAEMELQQKDFEIKNNQFQENLKIYNRNVSLIALGGAILIVMITILFLTGQLLLADGLLLGGIFTLGYSLIRAFQSDNNIFRFIVVSVGLIMVLYVGYFRFSKLGKDKL